MSTQFINTEKTKQDMYITTSSFNENVWYLENTDFDINGNFVSKNFGNTPILIMVQADWCGACKIMKPYYQKTADIVKEQSLDVIMTTIDYKENKNLLDRISEPNSKFPFRVDGFPTIVLYMNGQYVKHNTGALRSVKSILDYIKVETNEHVKSDDRKLKIRRGAYE